MRNKTQIFNFHSISDKLSVSYPTVPVKAFDRICAFLNRNYIVVPLDEIGNKINSQKPRAIITFDDGFYDFYSNALPVLTKHKLHATQHLVVESVNTGRTHWSQKLNDILDAYYFNSIELCLPELGIIRRINSRSELRVLGLTVFYKILKDDSLRQLVNKLEEPVAGYIANKRMMNWDEVLDCTKYNIVFGSHTFSHRTLTQLTEVEIMAEVINSKLEIERRLNYDSCLSLAYPNGVYDAKVKEFCINAGYRYLLTTVQKSVNMPVDRYELPRFDIYNEVYWKNILKILICRYFI